MLDGTVLAIVVRSDFEPQGIEFITDNSEELQLGVMLRSQSTPVELHKHLPVDRQLKSTKEFIWIRFGHCEIRVFSDVDEEMYRQFELFTGDCVLLLAAKHSIDFLIPSSLLEIKQGPYIQVFDKAFYQKSL